MSYHPPLQLLWVQTLLALVKCHKQFAVSPWQPGVVPFSFKFLSARDGGRILVMRQPRLESAMSPNVGAVCLAAIFRAKHRAHVQKPCISCVQKFRKVNHLTTTLQSMQMQTHVTRKTSIVHCRSKVCCRLRGKTTQRSLAVLFDLY